MCLSTVYMDSNGETKEVVKEVASLEAKDDGYLFVNLFGEETFVKGRLFQVDFVEENAIIMKEP
jgi:predicted RNA-binding protein